MPGPSRLPATSGHRSARTSRGIVGGTPDNNTSHRAGHRSLKVHPGVRADHMAAAAAAPGEGTVPEIHDGGPELASVGAARLAVSLVARAVLFALLGMLAWAVLPFALGWQPTTVMTGSMEPRISAGDVVIARPIPTGTASLGHILLVDDPDHANKLRLHRYVEDTPDGNLVLRGDANSANDSSPVTPEAVHGVAVLRVPFVGLPLVWIAEKNWGSLAAVFVAVSALTLAAAAGSSAAPRGASDPSKTQGPAKTEGTDGRQRPTQAHTARPGRPAIRRRFRAATRRTHAVRALLCLAALPLLVAPELLLAAPAHAAYSAAAPTNASSFAALSSYPCLSPTVQDNPSLFFAFNEDSETVAEDASGSGRNGLLRGATTRVAGSCAAGQSPALALNGSSGYVSTPQLLSAPDTFTVEIWFKVTPGATGGRLLGFGDAQTGDSTLSDRHLYMTDSGAISFGAATRNGSSQNYKATAITSPTSYDNGQWHLATATMTPAGSVLYVDGVQVAANKALVAERAYSGYWRVGYDSMDFDKNRDWPGAATSSFFAGSIDNAAVYPTALTAAQAQAHYAAGR
ncbi:LamG-like jellyroll fold domain-containing protein [Arthrobacter sp. 2MCAF15]|uniref:LamG-like jellyroll fold domain-containing protein n=1 Tax=Arthrobacter sp. 2MCAF15 TaxID=3232984 RepID=UPI003F931F5C